MATEKDTSTVSSKVAKWCREIDTYESKFKPWEERSKKIVKRYRDERKAVAKSAAKFNVLWSNVQTLHPAIYANPPTPNIDRRFQDDDDLGRYAALTLERAVTYYVKDDLFDKVMKQVTLDRLLPGRGTAWVRFCPVFDDQNVQLTDDSEDSKPEGKEEGDASSEDVPNLLSEDVVADYVHWTDFGHTWGRTWQEVDGVWRKVYLNRTKLVQRFGDKIGNEVPLDAKAEGSDEKTPGIKATIYEIWDKSTRKVIWLSKNMPEVLDEKDDPLGLKDFFPCPQPLYATLSNEDLVPSPDYTQYQDQAIELDNITARITAITKAVRVAGVYDASAEGIDRLLSEGVENKLIPVDQFAVLGGGKGLDGVVSFFPLETVVSTLKTLYEARSQVKNDLYEITGISDVVRGATKATETATAQQLKGQYASLRLDYQQKDAARFSRDLVRLFVEVIANHFDVETIKQVSGVKLLTEHEKQQIQIQQDQEVMQAQKQAQMTGQEPQPPKPLPEKVQELMEMPSWEEVMDVIRDDTARSFRIDIETDSTIKTDQEAEKQSRMEFLTAVSGFMQQAVSVPPELRTLTMELLMFGVRGFKISRELETSFEAAMDKLRKEEENPQPQQPNPEQIKADAEMQRTQAEMQIQQIKSQSDMQMMQAKMQADQAKAQTDLLLKQADIRLKEMDLQLKQFELQIKAEDVKARAVEAANPNNQVGA